MAKKRGSTRRKTVKVCVVKKTRFGYKKIECFRTRGAAASALKRAEKRGVTGYTLVDLVRSHNAIALTTRNGRRLS